MNFIRSIILILVGLFKKGASKTRLAMDISFENGYSSAKKKGFISEQALLIHAVQESLILRLVFIGELNSNVPEERTMAEVLPFIYLDKKTSKKAIQEYVIMHHYPGEEDKQFLKKCIKEAIDLFKKDGALIKLKYENAIKDQKENVKWTDLFSDQELNNLIY